MFKNYFKIAWRNIVKGKLYSVINISGLAIGIACCLLIGLYVFEELRYDRFHEDADQIHRVNLTLSNESKSTTMATTPRFLATMLADLFPEVEDITSLDYEDGVVRYGNELSDVTFTVIDSSFFDVFNFKVLAGDAASSLKSANDVLISSTIAEKLYGKANPIGEVLDLRINGEFYPATIGAVVEDAPSYSSISYEVLVPEPLWETVDPGNSRNTNVGAMAGVRYAKLAPDADTKQLSKNIVSAIKSQFPEHLRANQTYSFQPLTAIHFGDQVMWSETPTVNPNFVIIAVIIALLILGISCINFTSLSIGYSSRRAKEVGMRKVIGAERKQLILQFWSETFFIALLSLVLGLLLAEVLAPYFSNLIGHTPELNLFGHPIILLVIGVIVLLTAVLAGSYPALYLSKFKPSHVFQKQVSPSSHKLIPVLTTVQFSLAIALITGTIFMNNQMKLLSDKNLGFDEQHVIQLEIPYREGQQILSSLRNDLTNQTNILGISGSWNNLDGEGVEFNDLPFQSDGKEIRGAKFGMDPNLPKVLDMDILAGDDLSRVSNSTNQEVLVNESLINAFGWEDPIGKRIDGSFGDTFIVRGVVEDFHFKSLHEEIAPLILEPTDTFTKIYLKINGQQISSSIDAAAEAWKATAPGLPFQFSFLDDKIEKQYQSDQQWVAIVQTASYLSILLSCLGLFGLATLASSKRRKEISIRKVLGATLSSIVFLLSKDFLKPVFIGLIIGVPLASFLLNFWLQDFAYKIELNPLTFLIAGLATIVIALLTVSWQSIKAALANPVESLRSE